MCTCVREKLQVTVLKGTCQCHGDNWNIRNGIVLRSGEVQMCCSALL